MNSQTVTFILLLLGLFAGANALQCWATDLQNPSADPRNETVLDETGQAAAHGLCLTMTATMDRQKAEVFGWIGWSEENNDRVTKCLKDNGIEAGKCIDGDLNLNCDEWKFRTFSNTTLKALLQEPTITSCFCDQDLCNVSNGGPGCPECSTVTTTVTVTSTSTTTTEVKTCKNRN